MTTWLGETKCPQCGHWQIPMNFCPSCGYAFGGVFTSQGSLTMRAADVLDWCGCEVPAPTTEAGKCSQCGKNAHR